MFTKEQIAYVKQRLRDIQWDKDNKISKPKMPRSSEERPSKRYPEEINAAITIINAYRKEQEDEYYKKRKLLQEEYNKTLDLLMLKDKKAIDPFQLLEDFQKYNPE